MPGSPKPPPAIVYENAWMRVVSKRVTLRPDAAPEDYFVVEAGDWAAICPRTADGRFVLVEQYRPAIERRVLEFPAGTIDQGETPAASIQRELLEETGHSAARLVSLGNYFTDTGRLSNRAHLFYGEVAAVAGRTPEPGLVASCFTVAEIDRLIADGSIVTLHHIGLWLLVKAAGLIAG